jgi:hypothetical protein
VPHACFRSCCCPAGFVFDMFFPPNYPNVPPKVSAATEVLAMLQLNSCQSSFCCIGACCKCYSSCYTDTRPHDAGMCLQRCSSGCLLACLLCISADQDYGAVCASRALPYHSAVCCCACVQVNLVTTGNGSVRFNPSECRAQLQSCRPAVPDLCLICSRCSQRLGLPAFYCVLEAIQLQCWALIVGLCSAGLPATHGYLVA